MQKNKAAKGVRGLPIPPKGIVAEREKNSRHTSQHYMMCLIFSYIHDGFVGESFTERLWITAAALVPVVFADHCFLGGSPPGQKSGT